MNAERRAPEPNDDGDEKAELKVGELAERIGLTVRTLHWYDEIGLLPPARRTRAGHRIYGPDQVERLQRIRSLRHVGLSLQEIRDVLDRDDLSLLQVLELHAARLEEEAERLRLVAERIDRALDAVRDTGRVEVHTLIDTMEAMAMYEKYYTPEQLETLAKRRREVGEERIREVEEEWRELYRRLGEAMADGADPGSPRVQTLAEKAQSLIREFTGGDPGIRASLERMYQDRGTEPLESHGFEVDDDLHAFLNRAVRLREGEPDADR